MNALLYTLAVVVFVVGVLASIALHEVGHMYPAKKFGIKVTQYFVGFGRTVWSVRRGETEYGVKSVPLGGYVKLVGMLPPNKGDDPTKVRDTNTGMFTQLIADARNAEYEHVQPGDEDRLFYRQAWWKKLIVMSGGPLVNVAIAFLLFGAIFMTIGAQTYKPTASSVADCVIPAKDAGRKCTDADPVAPAKQARLEVGDKITSFDGKRVDTWDELTTLIRGNGDRSATLVIERNGRTLTRQVTTTVQPRQSLSDPTKLEKVGFLGVTPTVGYQRQGLGYVLSTMWDYTAQTGKAIVHLPQKMVEVAKAAFGGTREQDSPMSPVGASRVAGEMVTADGTTWTDRVYRVGGLIAAVNLFVALFNFLPLLPLDGGHIVGALWEGLRGGIARLRGRPDPGFVDVGKMLPVAYGVGALLLVMGVLLVYADIVNPVRFT